VADGGLVQNGFVQQYIQLASQHAYCMVQDVLFQENYGLQNWPVYVKLVKRCIEMAQNGTQNENAMYIRYTTFNVRF
jgi:hypothetical protein